MIVTKLIIVVTNRNIIMLLISSMKNHVIDGNKLIQIRVTITSKKI